MNGLSSHILTVDGDSRLLTEESLFVRNEFPFDVVEDNVLCVVIPVIAKVDSIVKVHMITKRTRPFSFPKTRRRDDDERLATSWLSLEEFGSCPV